MPRFGKLKRPGILVRLVEGTAHTSHSGSRWTWTWTWTWTWGRGRGRAPALLELSQLLHTLCPVNSDFWGKGF